MSRKNDRRGNDMRLSVKKNVFPAVAALGIAVLLLFAVLAVTYLKSGGTSSDSGIGKLYINEVMTSNKGSLMAPDGSVCDWVELYNNSDKDIDASGYALALQDGNGIVFPSDTEVTAGGYLIVYCNNTNLADYMCAPFTLAKAGGETLVLKNADGTALDSVTTVKMTSNSVMVRKDYSASEWSVTAQATPGYENSDKGFEAMVTDRSSSSGEKTVVVNEFCTKNTCGAVDEDGDCNDWIEIKNVSSEEINLAYYSLGSTAKTPFEWQFPDVTIKPGEIMLIFCSGKDIHEEGKTLHTGFTLKNSDICVCVTDSGGNIIDSASVDTLSADASYARGDDGKYGQTFATTPGYENNAEGYEKACAEQDKSKTSLVIFEAMSKNRDYLKQNGGKAYDWVEIKNVSSEDIDLSQYYLSNDSGETEMWQMPNKTLYSGDSIVVICSGSEALSNSSYYHCNFKINGDEQVYIFKDGGFVDGVCCKGTKINESMTRADGKSGFHVNTSPSPKDTDGDDVYYGVASKPVIETASGVFEEGTVTVSISGNGDIYYTTDGTAPTVNSLRYTAPFDVSETVTVHAVSYSDGMIRSETACASYIIGENDSLPVMAISMDSEDLYSDSKGIYAKGYYASSTLPYEGANFWKDWERTCKAEFFENGSGFSIDCGIKIFGAYSRGEEKKSFQLKFRDIYGEGDLKYAVFDDTDIQSYESLVLRSGSQDFNHAMIRDEFFTSLLKKYSESIYVQAYKPCALYINGEFFGIYYLREKINADYVSKHLNADVTQTTLLTGNEAAVYGSNAEFKELRSYIETHSMRNSEYYEYAKKNIDFESLIDFTIGEFYSGNQDNGNVKWFKNTDGDGKWHWIYFDLDWAFYYDTTIARYLREEGRPAAGFRYLNKLIYNLLKNDEFRDLFMTRLAYHLKNTFSEDVALEHLDSVANEIRAEMPKEIERWGYTTYLTMDKWEKELDKMRRFIKTRKEFMLEEVRDWFDMSSSEYNKYFGDL